MNNTLIKVNCSDISIILKLTFSKNINVYNIKQEDNYVILEIDNRDLNTLSKLFDIEVIKDKSFKYLVNSTIKKVNNIILLIIGIILFMFLSNIIVKVNILSNNLELVKELSKVLDDYGIKRLSIKKDYIKLQEIKNNILDKYKDKLEWLEIENNGMTYNIKLEERKSIIQEINKGKCNVVALSDGIVTKIIANKGVIMVKNNQFVKEGDVLITGNITLNDEVKDEICASGKVYAEKWYSISIDMPTTYTKKEYTNKKRYNLLFELDNRDYKIFKSRLNNYDSDKEEIVSILNKKLYLIKEYEYVLKNLKYDENSLNKRIDELIQEKLNLSLLDNEKILVKNVLKKYENDSRIKIELFVTIERLISKQVAY